MLTRSRAAGLLWPTCAALAALALLLGLGTWQMQRKAWKEGLIAQIKAGISAAPSPVSPHERGQWPEPGEPREYRRLAATGRFLHADERHVYAPRAEGPGWLVFTPLELTQAPQPTLLLVNRGWVPDSLKSPHSRVAGLVDGTVRVVGLARTPEVAGTFTPLSEPQRNTWFSRDIKAMAAALPCRASGACLTTFYLDAEAEPVSPGGWPKGGTTNLALPNRHLEYALTWYGLAAALVGVWLALIVSRTGQSRSVVE